MKRILTVAVLLLTMTFTLASCDDVDTAIKNNVDSSDTSDTAVVTTDTHVHSFSAWSIKRNASCAEKGLQERACSSCGFAEQAEISELSHTPVKDAATEATCSSVGKTEGSHCGVCGTVIVAQQTVNAKGHTSVTDAAVAATCSSEGKTEGSRCDVCGAVIVAQQTVNKAAHAYDSGVVITPATRLQAGTKKYICTTPTCSASYTGEYSLPEYSATEIYHQAVKFVGEISTYDRFENALALGTGFVLSSDGKIVTNYHVIDGAYSASIDINGHIYQISSVLAYDANIDLAILKIDASNLTAAPIYKGEVEVGETVYAIGSSRGMTNTYTQGMVACADRVVDGVSHVQHDASITHGNSGGPLINEYGEVIGINTWGIDDSQNLNFAVSATELDNLTCGTPIALYELYESLYGARDVLMDYLCTEGTYDADSEMFVKEFTETDGETDLVYVLSYDVNNDLVLLTLATVDNSTPCSVFASLTFDCTPDGFVYICMYDSTDDSNMTAGYITPSSFTQSTSSISCMEFYGMESNKDALLVMYASYFKSSLTWLEGLLEADNVGITLADLGFTSFS